MLRLSPPGFERFIQCGGFDACYAGSEANTAAAFAFLGYDSSFVSCVPAHEIGQAAVNALRRYGVDVSGVRREGERLGIYFCEKGASQRPSKVIYDRKDSAFALCSPGGYDWETLLSGASWFHFSGITPAVSERAAKACLDAVKEAERQGVPVSMDVNYRSKLWTKEEAGKVLTELAKHADVLFCNEEDAANVFGIRADRSDAQAGTLSLADYEETAEKLTERFGLRAAAVSLRRSHSASDNTWGGMLYTGGRAFVSRDYEVRIVDRVGAGDSFSAGIVSGFLDGRTPQETVEFAAAYSCLKHTVEGDLPLISRGEAEALLCGSGSGRVIR